MTYRRILALLLCLVLTVSLGACGKKAAEQPEEPKTAAAAAPAEEPNEEEEPEPVDMAQVWEGIAYFGDAGSCQMTREMAAAYEEVLQEKQAVGPVADGGEGDLKVLMADVNGDGYPLMLTAYVQTPAGEDLTYISPIEVWEYREGEAKQVQPTFETSLGYTALSIQTLEGRNYLQFSDGMGFEIGDCTGWVSYSVEKGQTALAHRVMMYSGFSDDEETMWYRDAAGETYTALLSDLEAEGWTLKQDDFGGYSGFAYYYDGNLDYDRVEEVQAQAVIRTVGYWGDVPGLEMSFSDRDAVRAALTKIAGK